MNMAANYLKFHILQRAMELYKEFHKVIIANFSQYFEKNASKEDVLAKLDYKLVEEIFTHLEYDDAVRDARSETRDNINARKTNLAPKVLARHYEVEVLALQVKTRWIAFDYLYGGGKHSNPERAYDWLNNAWFVDCETKREVVITHTFSEIENTPT